MFEIGDHVVCGSKGVCTVENITTLDISGVEKDRLYYILKPLYVSGSTVYVPVDSPGGSMRKVLGRREAQELIELIPEIPPLTITNDKLTEQMYKECIKANDCEELVRIIKTIYIRRQKRLQAGRKVTAVDEKYNRLAEDNLYGELAVALEIGRKDVEGYIAESVSGRNAAAWF